MISKLQTLAISSVILLILFFSSSVLPVIANDQEFDRLVAEKKFEEARKFLNDKKAKCKGDLCLADIHLGFAKIEIKKGDKESAKIELDQSFELIKNHYGSNHDETANYCNKIGDILHGELYLFKDAVSYYQIALDIYQRKEPADSAAIITTLNNIGLSYVFEGAFELAEENHKKALDLALNTSNLDPLILHDTYTKLGGLYTKTIEYDLAETNLQKAIEVWEIANMPDTLVQIAKTYEELSYVVAGRGNYAEAVLLGKKAIEILENRFGENSSRLILPCLDISWCYESQGEFEEALQYTGRALALVKMHYDPNHYYMAAALSGLGHIYFKMHRNEEAVKYYTQVLQIDSIDNPALDQPVVAVDFHRLGLAYKALSRSREALTMINKALEIQTKRFGENGLRLINTINNIGAVYSDLQLYDSARFYFRKSLSICKSNEEKSTLDFINIHKNMAETYNRESKHALALEEINTSLSYMKIETGENGELIVPDFELLNFKEHLMYILRNRSTALLGLYKETGNTDELFLAYENHLLHRKIYEYSIENSVAKGSQLFQASAIANSNEEAIYILYELYHKSNDNKYILEAWQQSEKSKAILLSRTINEKKLKKIAGIPQEVLDEEKRLKVKLSKFYVEYANLNFEIDDKNDSTFIASKNEFFETKSEYESFVGELKRNYPSYFELTHFEHTASIDQMSYLLEKNNEAIIEYVEGIDKLYAIVITHENSHFVSMAGKDSLVTAANNMLTSILENNFDLYVQNAHYIYRNYFEILQPLFNQFDISNITIVPDNYLGFIPFDALVKNLPSQNGDFSKLDYLLYDYNFSYAYSSTVKYQNETTNRKTVDGLLAFAPEFSQKASKKHMTRNAEILTSLPHASMEVERITSLFNGKGLIGQEATERYFKENAEKYKVIHLATHAVMDDENPELSRLYFHQANDSIEDNILHAHEIYNMQLNAELVTLSACNTGSGKIYKGEGIASLGRAFIYAGCPNILLSMWAVSDKSTSEIMTTFYAGLKEGQPKSVALRRSKLQYLKNADANTSDPFYWAAFSIIGSSDPLIVDNSKDLYLIFGGCLLFIVVAFSIYQRKN